MLQLLLLLVRRGLPRDLFLPWLPMSGGCGGSLDDDDDDDDDSTTCDLAIISGELGALPDITIVTLFLWTETRWVSLYRVLCCCVKGPKIGRNVPPLQPLYSEISSHVKLREQLSGSTESQISTEVLQL